MRRLLFVFAIALSAHVASAATFDDLPNELAHEILNGMRGDDAIRFAATSSPMRRIVSDYKNQDIEHFVKNQSDKIKYRFEDMADKIILMAVASERKFVVVKSPVVVEDVDRETIADELNFIIRKHMLYYVIDQYRNRPVHRSRSTVSNGYRYSASIYTNSFKYSSKDVLSCLEVAVEKIEKECVGRDMPDKCHAHSFACGIGIDVTKVTTFGDLPNDVIHKILNGVSHRDLTRLAETSRPLRRIVSDYKNYDDYDIDSFVNSQSDAIKYGFDDMAKKIMFVGVTYDREFVVVKSSTVVENVDRSEITGRLELRTYKHMMYYSTDVRYDIPIIRSGSTVSNGYRYLISTYTNVFKYAYEDLLSCLEVAIEKIANECVGKDVPDKCYAYSSACGVGIDIVKLR